MDSKPLRVSKNGKRMMVKSATGAFEWVDVPQPAADERVPAFLTPSPTTGQPVVAEPLGANGYRLITLVVLLAAFAALVYLALR